MMETYPRYVEDFQIFEDRFKMIGWIVRGSVLIGGYDLWTVGTRLLWENTLNVIVIQT